MQINYRYVSCPNCGGKLRLTVKDEKSLGEPIEVTCTKCGDKFKTMLPLLETPPDAKTDHSHTDNEAFSKEELSVVKPLMEEFGNVLRERVETSLELYRVVQKLKAAGCDITLELCAMIGLSKLNSPANEPVPLVKNGEVVPGAFTAKDGNWLKDFRIDLNS